MRASDFSEAREIFAHTNAIITGDHFVYAKKEDGWYHGYDYVNKDAVYPFVRQTKKLCSMIGLHFADRGIATVIGPAIGGVILSQWVTDYFIQINDLGNQYYYSVFAEEVGEKRVLKRGYDKYVKDRRCLLVDDVITGGTALIKTRAAVLEAGGDILGVASLCNRSGGKVTARTLGVPELVSLVDVDMKMFPEKDCPICRERGVESVRTDLGKGAEFLRRIGKVT